MELHGGNIYSIERELGIKKKEIIDFSSNINPLGISDNLRNIIINNLDAIRNYPDPDYVDLKTALAEYNNTPIENILAGNGATELIYLFARTLKPKTVLIISPTFVEYSIALKQAGAIVKHYKLKEENEFMLNINDLKKELNKSYGLLVICNPNNPTSKFIGHQEIKEIIAYADKKNTIVMLDESFIEFIDPGLIGDTKKKYIKHKNLFILRSLTKFFAIPGLRLGYAVAFNNKLILNLRRNQEPWTINQFADIAGRALINDEEYIKETIRLVNNEKIFLYESLNKTEWFKVYSPAANFILIKILKNITSAGLKSYLLNESILIRDASNFRFLNNKFIRIAVKDRKNNELLLKKLNNIFNIDI